MKTEITHNDSTSTWTVTIKSDKEEGRSDHEKGNAFLGSFGKAETKQAAIARAVNLLKWVEGEAAAMRKALADT